jgi:hypothetical protein
MFCTLQNVWNSNVAVKVKYLTAFHTYRLRFLPLSVSLTHRSELCDFCRTHQIMTRSLHHAPSFQHVNIFNVSIPFLKYVGALHEEPAAKKEVRDPKKSPRHMLREWESIGDVFERFQVCKRWTFTRCDCVNTHRMFCKRHMTILGIWWPSEARFVHFSGKTRPFRCNAVPPRAEKIMALP